MKKEYKFVEKSIGNGCELYKQRRHIKDFEYEYIQLTIKDSKLIDLIKYNVVHDSHRH